MRPSTPLVRLSPFLSAEEETVTITVEGTPIFPPHSAENVILIYPDYNMYPAYMDDGSGEYYAPTISIESVTLNMNRGTSDPAQAPHFEQMAIRNKFWKKSWEILQHINGKESMTPDEISTTLRNGLTKTMLAYQTHFQIRNQYLNRGSQWSIYFGDLDTLTYYAERRQESDLQRQLEREYEVSSAAAEHEKRPKMNFFD